MATHAEITRYAVELAKRGYAVYPLNLTYQGGKKSFSEQWTGSSNDVDAVRRMFDQRSDANGVIIDCGKSGVVVVDADTGNGKNAYGNLHAAGVELPESPMVGETISGGEHRFFRQPDTPVRNQQNTPVDHVDMRGVGGMVFAPPTSCDGGGYEFKTPAIRVVDLPVLPAWFVDLVQPGKAATADKPDVVDSDGYTTEQTRQHEQWFEQDLDRLRNLRDGDRHNPSLQPIRRIVDRGSKIGFTREFVTEMILDAYHESGGTDDADIVASIEGGYRLAESEPLAAASGATSVDPDVVDDDGIRAAVEDRKRQMRVTATAKAEYVDETTPSFGDMAPDIDLGSPPPDESDRVWVDGLVRKNEVNALLGKSFAGKSFVAVDVAMSMAAGLQWVGGTKTHPGKVLYLAGEDTDGLQARVWQWCRDRGVGFPHGRIQLRGAVPLLESERLTGEVAQLVEDGGFDLVIVDTLKRAIEGIGWNENGRLQAASSGLDRLVSRRADGSVLVLAHPNAEGEFPGGQMLKPDIFSVTKVTRDDGDNITLTNDKWKNGAQPLWPSAFHIRRPGVLDMHRGPFGSSHGAADDLRRREAEEWQF